MESFFKNFDYVLTLFKSAPTDRKRFNFRNRTTSETVVAGAFFLIAAAILLQYAFSGSQWLAVLVLLLIGITTLVYVRDSDSLLLNEHGDLIVNRGLPGFKRNIHIPRASIQFIGVGIGEKFPATGRPHLVYIKHNDKVTALRHFSVGREAVVLAKQVKQFVGV